MGVAAPGLSARPCPTAPDRSRVARGQMGTPQQQASGTFLGMGMGCGLAGTSACGWVQLSRAEAEQGRAARSWSPALLRPTFGSADGPGS